MAHACTLLSSATTFGDRAEIYGWLRNVGNPTARHYRRERSAATKRNQPEVNTAAVVYTDCLLSHKESDNLRVVLVATRNPLNIGATARAMSNFGFERLRVVNPYQLAFREARSAVGAAALLRQAEECKDLAEAVSDCSLVVGTTAAQNRELRHSLKGLEPAARLIRRTLAKGTVALLFGSEKRGLSNDDLSYCHWLM